MTSSVFVSFGFLAAILIFLSTNAYAAINLSLAIFSSINLKASVFIEIASKLM